MKPDNAPFAALPPFPATVVIAGENLDITPLKVGELPTFARAVRSIAIKLSPDPDWLSLLSEDGECVILALAIACRRPHEWVAGLALDDAIHLAEMVFEANADFFIRRVVPEVMRVAGGINARIGTLIPGPTSSSDSFTAGTVTPTS